MLCICRQSLIYRLVLQQALHQMSWKKQSPTKVTGLMQMTPLEMSYAHHSGTYCVAPVSNQANGHYDGLPVGHTKQPI